MEKKEIPAGLAKVTSNDKQEMIYIPKRLVRALGLSKGTLVMWKLDPVRRRIIIEPAGSSEAFETKE